MLQTKIGISDMAFYVPSPRLLMSELVKRRSATLPQMTRHLERALRTTGQESLRYPSFGEDPATMAAEASFNLLRQLEARRDFQASQLRYLVAGTESGIDHSKPLSAQVSGMLSQAGHPLPPNLSSFQVQHACAGATLAAISVSSLLAGYGRPDETGLVVASDIARYQTETTAEVTQGSGASAILLSQNPSLLELDLATMGFSSQDVDDFFRPLGSAVAQVNGRYSMECYQKSLEAAFADHAQRSGASPADLLHQADILVLHAPFARMPIEAMNKLLAAHLGLSAEGSAEYLASKAFYQGLEPVARIGNTYTASVFMVLAWLLRDLYRELGQGIVGKKLLLASYGSGNTMVVLSATVASRAPDIIGSWNLDAHLENARDSSWEDYVAWSESGYSHAPIPAGRTVKESGFILESIREDGYRIYGYRPQADRPLQEADIQCEMSLLASSRA